LISHESPPDHPTPLQTLLPPYKLRSKVRIKDVSDEWDTWAAWDDEIESGGLEPKRVWKSGSGGANESQWSWPEGVRPLGLGEDEIGCWDLRAGLGMRQLLVPKGQQRESGLKCQLNNADSLASISSDHEEVSTEEYHLHRMVLGLPEGPSEVVPGAALPLESSMDIHGGGE
jgi:hypothetical protein